jgi:hypothetical protein
VNSPPELTDNSTSGDNCERVGRMEDEREFCISVSEIRQRIFNMP